MPEKCSTTDLHLKSSTFLLHFSTSTKSHWRTGLQKIVWAGLELALLGHVLRASWRKETGSEGLGDLWTLNADRVDSAGGLSVTAVRDLQSHSQSPPCPGLNRTLGPHSVLCREWTSYKLHHMTSQKLPLSAGILATTGSKQTWNKRWERRERKQLLGPHHLTH